MGRGWRPIAARRRSSHTQGRLRQTESLERHQYGRSDAAGPGGERFHRVHPPRLLYRWGGRCGAVVKWCGRSESADADEGSGASGAAVLTSNPRATPRKDGVIATKQSTASLPRSPAFSAHCTRSSRPIRGEPWPKPCGAPWPKVDTLWANSPTRHEKTPARTFPEGSTSLVGTGIPGGIRTPGLMVRSHAGTFTPSGA